MEMLSTGNNFEGLLAATQSVEQPPSFQKPGDQPDRNAQADDFATKRVRDTGPTQNQALEQNHSKKPMTVPATYQSGYMERSSYLAPDKFRGEDGTGVCPVDSTQMSPDMSKAFCDISKVFDYPSRAVREGLLENFWTYCYPWEPIVEKSQVVGIPPEKISPLLLQAIFLAGSRMSSVASRHATSQDFYQRAKTLFFVDYEQDALTLLIATSLLHWWNPHGPERVSTNTSSYWCRTAVGLAQQMGFHRSKRVVADESLRRRLWWSLVARDCLISAAHGRPPAINLDDCDIPKPNLNDFVHCPSTGHLFLAYVDLSLIIGRFVQTSPMALSPSIDIESSLCLWIKSLPEPLRLSSYSHERSRNQFLKPYHFESRQLNVMYFVSIILLHRQRSLDGPFPAPAVLGSSFIAGIFEDFLARDQVRFLNPVFTFYLLAAAISLLSCCKYPYLWQMVQEDLAVISQAQEEMKKKWPLASGSINTFNRMHKLTIATQKRSDALLNTQLTTQQSVFFNDIDTSLCRMWDILHNDTVTVSSHVSQPITAFEMEMEMTAIQPSENLDMLQTRNHLTMDNFRSQAYPEEAPDNMAFEAMFQDGAQLSEGIGDWLFWDETAFGVN